MNQLAQQLANGVMTGSIYGLLAVALALVFGVLEISQFAMGAMAMIGGYVVYLTSGTIGYWLAILLAMFVVGCLGGLAQRLMFEPLRKAPPATVFVAAYALLLVLQGGAAVIWGSNPKTVAPPIDSGFNILHAQISYQRLIIVATVLAVVILLNLLLKYTQFGRRIRATGQNTTGALVVGISARWIALATMAIGGALAGLAGGLLAPISTVYPTMGSDLIVKAFIIIVLAGMGSIWGSLIVAYVIGLVESFGAAYISADLYSLALLLIVLLVRPSGVFTKSSVRL